MLHRHGPTVLLVLFCLLAGVPAAIALTPGRGVDAFGQHITVGARPPDLSLAGPARVVQVGNTSLDLERFTVYGPLRPQLTLGPVQRNADSDAVFDPGESPRVAAEAVGAVTNGYLSWFLWGGLGQLAFTLTASAVAAGVRTLLVLRRQSRSAAGSWPDPAHPDPVHPFAAIWVRCVRAASRTTVIAVAVSLVAWGALGGLAYSGAVRGLSGVTSLAQIVGAPTTLTQGEFDYRLAAFDRAYGDLLVDLSELPGHPPVIVSTSYGVFPPDADCPDVRVEGYPSLDRSKIELLTARNERLNDVLSAGAEKYGFSVARPELRPLCDPAGDGLGPDIQGLADPFPFHPTGIGSLRMASSVVRLVQPTATR